MQNKNCNVLIVGFGPTGAVLANLLSKYDLSIQILEKESQIYNLPRACRLYTSPSPRDATLSRMPSSA